MHAERHENDGTRQNATTPAGGMGYTQLLTPKRRMLDGISIAQVVAGAAAAATSMLLASRIGIAGSVIGAAVSSAVTIVCSQLYRHALDASAEKLRRAPQRNSRHAPAVETPAVNGFGETPRYEAAETQMMSGMPAPKPSDPAPGARRPATRIAPAKLQARAAAERSATQRKVIIASAALAFLAVALTAGAILLSTAGQGLGARPAPLLPAPAPTEQDAAANTQEGQIGIHQDADDATGQDAGSQVPDATAPGTGTDQNQNDPENAGDNAGGQEDGTDQTDGAQHDEGPDAGGNAGDGTSDTGREASDGEASNAGDPSTGNASAQSDTPANGGAKSVS